MSEYITRSEFALHATAEEANQRITNDRLSEGNTRMERIEDRLDRHAEASEARHSALIQSINSYMEKQAEVEAAFLTTKDGRRDFFGHYVSHETDETRKITWRRRFDTITTAVMVSAAIGVLAWLGSLAWKGFLAGPIKP